MRINSAARRPHVFVALLLLAFVACGELDPVATYEPITDPDQLFMTLALNHRAINLSTAAPYDEVQLVATPRSASGGALTGLPAVTYRSSDTTRVWVDPDGLVRARRAGNNLTVIAEIVTSDNIRRADTAYVNVIGTTPPQIATFTLDPVPPAERVWHIQPISVLAAAIVLSPSGIDLSNRLTLRVLDPDERPITGLQAHYASLDRIVNLNRRFGGPNPIDVGQARIVASTFAYGVTHVDTVTYKVTLPLAHAIQFIMAADSTFTMNAPGAVIRPGGYVAWMNANPKPLEVLFDDPAAASGIPEACATLGEPHCGAGNIPAFDGSGGFANSIRARQFHTPGEYTFRTSTGVTGRVTVRGDDTP